MTSAKSFFYPRIRRGLIFQYLAALTGTLNIICSGLHYAWPSPSLPQILGNNTQIPTTDDEGSWIAVMLLIGAAFGSLLAAVVLDRFGRKKVVLFTSIPFFVSWMMVAFAPSVGVLLAARFIAGISDGLIFCSIPMYLAEIADPKIRGLLGSGITVMLMFGLLLMNVIGSYLTITTTALVCSALPVVLLLTFIWMPETPYYLIMKGKIGQARQSLKIFKGSEDVEQELNRLMQAVEEQNTNTGKYFDLFTVKSNRRAIYVVMGSRAAQQCCGITAINFYIQTVFKEAGDVISPVNAAIIYFAVEIVASAICSMVVDKTGRRPLMIISIIGSSLILLIEGCYFYIKNKTEIDTTNYSLIPIVALIIYVIIFNVGMQTIPLLLISELFPTNVKAFAFSFSDIYFCVITTIVAKFFQITKDEIGIHVPFFTFTACGVLGLIFIIFYVPETKGRTLEEIQQDLKGETVTKTLPEVPEKFKQVDGP